MDLSPMLNPFLGQEESPHSIFSRWYGQEDCWAYHYPLDDHHFWLSFQHFADPSRWCSVSYVYINMFSPAIDYTAVKESISRDGYKKCFSPNYAALDSNQQAYFLNIREKLFSSIACMLFFRERRLLYVSNGNLEAIYGTISKLIDLCGFWIILNTMMVDSMSRLKMSFFDSFGLFQRVLFLGNDPFSYSEINKNDWWKRI